MSKWSITYGITADDGVVQVWDERDVDGNVFECEQVAFENVRSVATHMGESESFTEALEVARFTVAALNYGETSAVFHGSVCDDEGLNFRAFGWSRADEACAFLGAA